MNEKDIKSYLLPDRGTLANNELESTDRIISYVNYCTCRCLETRHKTIPITIINQGIILKSNDSLDVIAYANCVDCLCMQYTFHIKKPYDPREMIASDDSIFGVEK